MYSENYPGEGGEGGGVEPKFFIYSMYIYLADNVENVECGEVCARSELGK